MGDAKIATAWSRLRISTDWPSPAPSKTTHQINYILVHSRGSSSIEDGRGYHGGITGNVNSTDCTLVRARFRFHVLARRKIQPYRRVDMSKLAITDNVKTLSNAITFKLAEVNEDGSSTALWMELKLSITNASPKQLDKAKWSRKD